MTGSTDPGDTDRDVARRIDREELVGRHRVVLTAPNPEQVLTVGNGDFGYSVDITGMQTFTQLHDPTAAWARALGAAEAGDEGGILAAPPVVNTRQ